MNINKKPKVAIVGAGVFGTNIALALDSFCEVTLFEKNADILQEGTRVNQFRHHYGYHYPRSGETVVDVQRSLKAFEDLYEDAIVRDTPTYYAIAKEGSHITSTEFTTFCDTYNLPYEEAHIDDFNPAAVQGIVKVPEPSYHYEKLAEMVKEKLQNTKNVSVRCGQKITALTVTDTGKKELQVANEDSEITIDEYDFVINATYSSINNFTKMGSFPVVPIRIDLTEVLIVSVPIEPISLTVLDGPFATLMPTGNPHEFTLYHAKESILKRYTPQDGLVSQNDECVSNEESILCESLKLFPALEKATVVESRYLHRAVQAQSESDDNRVAEIIPHGSGCWSVLSGKIVSSVYVAEKFSQIIAAELE
jgi:hypothetical protein